MGQKSELTLEPKTLFVLSLPLHHTRSAHGSTRARTHKRTQTLVYTGRLSQSVGKTHTNTTSARNPGDTTGLVYWLLSALRPEVSPRLYPPHCRFLWTDARALLRLAINMKFPSCTATSERIICTRPQ